MSGGAFATSGAAGGPVIGAAEGAGVGRAWRGAGAGKDERERRAAGTSGRWERRDRRGRARRRAPGEDAGRVEAVDGGARDR